MKTYSTKADREQRLIEACEITNEDPEVREIERDFDAFLDPMVEPCVAE